MRSKLVLTRRHLPAGPLCSIVDDAAHSYPPHGASLGRERVKARYSDWAMTNFSLPAREARTAQQMRGDGEAEAK
jgi:hypothetical protein